MVADRPPLDKECDRHSEQDHPPYDGPVELPSPRFDQRGGNRAQNEQRARHPAVKGSIAAEVDHTRGGEGQQDQRIAERLTASHADLTSRPAP